MTTRLSKIPSFVRRSGPLSPKQKLALEQQWQNYGLRISEQPFDLIEIFKQDTQVTKQDPKKDDPKKDTQIILEIGFGMGNSLIAMAQQNPNKNYLGIEVHRPGIANILANIAELQLQNIRICDQDAVEVLQHSIPAQSLSGVQIYFPDPWPKKRHHKRRLIQPDFIKLLCSKLKPNGTIHCATDWQEYAEQMLTVLSMEADLINTCENYAARPAFRPETKFEARGKNLGHKIWDLIFVKRVRPS